MLCSASSNVIRRRFRIPNRLFAVLFSNSAEALDCSVDVRIRQQMQESARLGDLDEAIRALNRLKPSILDYNGLLYSYLKSSFVSIEMVAGIFQGMKRFGPYPDVWSFKIIFNGLCSLGLLKDAFFVLEDMCVHGFVPSFALLRRLMYKSLFSGTFEILLQVIRMMLKFGYVLSLVGANRLIGGLCRAKSVDNAYRVFLVMPEMGLVPNVYTYNSLLYGVCNSGRCWKGITLFYTFRKKGLVPNVYSYTTLVLGFSNRGLWKEAYRVLEEMRMDGCPPTVVTYTILIKCLCKYGFVDEGLRILKVMSKEGCRPDLVTCNILLGVFFPLKRISDAEQLICIMEEEGLTPDQYTFCVVAAGLIKNGYAREAQDLLNRSLRGHATDIVTWNTFLHSLCVDNRVREAVTMLSCMIKKGFAPNNVTYNILIKGLCIECIDEALHFFDCIEWGNNGPHLISCNTILFEACKQRNFPIIWKFLDWLNAEGVKPSLASVTCLIEYFAKASNSEEYFRLYNYIIQNAYCSTTIACNVLLHNLCKKGLLSDAKRLFNKFKGFRTFPDNTSYNILIHAYVGEGNFRLVQCLLFDMYSWGLIPDDITYGYLTSGLCKQESIHATLDLEEQMVGEGERMSLSYYNPILASMFKKGRLWEAFLIMVKMEIEGIEGDEVSCKTFNSAMSTGGRKKLSKAMKVLEIIIKKAHLQSQVEFG